MFEKIISENNKTRIDLITAEGLYNFCITNNLGIGMTRNWGIKHFSVIIKALLPNENILLPFIGLYDYSGSTKHEGYYAFAITNKRIIIGQGKMIGQNLQTVELNNINDITLKTSTLSGNIIIDTYKETISIGLSSTYAENVYEKIQETINELKKTNTTQGNYKNDIVSELKQYKELLDLEIITQEEFDKKKKELLNL